MKMLPTGSNAAIAGPGPGSGLDSTIHRLLSDPVQVPYPYSEGMDRLVGANINEFRIALHWLLKLEGWPVKVPGKRAVAVAVKPTGVWLQSILRLCERSYSQSRLIGLPFPYGDPFICFEQIMLDFFALGKVITLINLYPPDDIEATGEKLRQTRDKKRMEIRLLHQVCSKVKALEKPKTTLVLGQLLDLSVALAERNLRFKSESFDPHTRALRAAITAIDGPGYLPAWVDDQKFFIERRGIKK